MVFQPAEGRGSHDTEDSDPGVEVWYVFEGREYLQRSVPARASRVDRHAVFRRTHGRPSMGRLSTVLSSLPGASDSDGVSRCPPESSAASSYGRNSSGSHQQTPAVA